MNATTLPSTSLLVLTRILMQSINRVIPSSKFHSMKRPNDVKIMRKFGLD